MCARTRNCVGAVLEVLAQLVALREELRPVVVGRERVGVEVVGDVDATAGIAVLQPGAADPVVLLDDHVGNAGVLETDRREQAGHPGADDHHPERRAPFVGHRRPVDRARVAAVERHLFEKHRDVLVADLVADHEAHHGAHGLERRRRGQRAPPIPVRAQRLERHGADRRLVLGRQPAVVLARQRPLRADRPGQDAGVAGEVHDRHHQRRHAGMLEDLGEERVALGDRRVRLARTA